MRILRGQVISFSDEGLVHHERGAVAIDGKKISWVGEWSNLPAQFRDSPGEDYDRKLILPGFIDPHIHFPQYRMLAAPAKDLLDWLNRFTFAEEARYGDPSHATAAAEIFLHRLISNGTTSALAFCSVHKTCAEALFAAAEKRDMALITGKTMMNRNAMAAVLDDVDQSARDTEALHKAWHGKSRLRHAISPRFAITSTEAQLKAAGELLVSLEGAVMQTHLSESAGEIALVKTLFPNAKDYTDVYDHFGLLSDRSLFAHGIHLGDREAHALSESGSSVIHCPTSNTFLGSGLLSFKHLRASAHPVQLGLATDVGGGTSYSMLATMAEAYKVQMLVGYKSSATELFRMATIGNARLLHTADETGSIAPGKFADLIVLDPQATPVLQARHALSNSLEEMLFSLMMLGDDRCISATYVSGKRLHG